MSLRGETDFVGMLYDAALGRIDWQTVVARMATVMGSETSSLIAHDPVRDRTSILGMHCLTDDYVEVYGSSFFQHDLWTHEALRRRRYDRATLGIELVSDADWEHSVIYNEFLRPRTDAFHLVGGMVRLHGGGVLAIGCHRPRKARPFSGEHKALLDRLMPHLKRAVEVNQRLTDERLLTDAAQRSLDPLATAIIHINDQGSIVHRNAAAEELLRRDDGLGQTLGRLRAASHAENVKLQALIAAAGRTTSKGAHAHGAGGHVRISRPSGRQALSVSVSPLGLDRQALSARCPAVLLMIDDPDHRESIDVAALRDLYALSPAEARVVVGIATGHRLRDMALRLDVTINTVRTLLARAMTKMETNSQSGIAKLVLTGPASSRSRSRPG